MQPLTDKTTTQPAPIQRIADLEAALAALTERIRVLEAMLQDMNP